jgi:hypothetical protein
VILLNFTHPLTADHLAQLETLTGQAVERVVDAPVQFDVMVSFVTQVGGLADDINLTPVEWQTKPILINPPALNVIAVTLMAELHGRMGYFPPVVRLRPGTFEVMEIINLQSVRDLARRTRNK